MPWQSSRSFRPIERHHYQAKCSDCPVDAEVCVKRMPAGEDAEQVAVRLLTRAGWHADGIGGFGRRRPDNARWLCPACAKAERRS
jgi:hypothetical protein